MKTFVLSMAEFLLRHTSVSKISFTKLDIYSRKLIHNKIGGILLTKDTFSIQAKDGSFGWFSLRDRYDRCKIANLGHSLNGYIRDTMKRYLRQIGRDRKRKQVSIIDQISERTFFNWEVDNNYELKVYHVAHYEITKLFQLLKISKSE
jgi:hypothetical protein